MTNCRHLLLLLLLMQTLGASTQVQRGYVKTKGTLTADNKVVPGQRVSGVLVSISGVQNQVLSQGSKGTFSFQVPAATYYLQGISKQGYQLADPEATRQPYSYSASLPMVIVVENPDARRQELAAVTRKIRRTMNEQLQQREDEIDRLREQNRISEQEKTRLLEQLNDRQEQNEKLISSMAQHFVSTDYDEVSQVNRRINQYILEGQLNHADSLLRTKGDVTLRLDDIRQEEARLEGLKRQMTKMQQRVRRKRDDVADDCYNRYLIAVSRYQNDTAFYYLQQRTLADTTNIEWMLQAGNFAQDYLADYELALQCYDRALHAATQQGYEQAAIWARFDKGALFEQIGQYELAANYFQQVADALPADSTQETLYMRASTANAMASIYSAKYQYDQANRSYEQALQLFERVLGADAEDVGIVCMNLGKMYNDMDQPDHALPYYERALAIFGQWPDEQQANLAVLYSGLGVAHKKLNHLDQALQYQRQSMDIKLKLYGSDHPAIATSYNNLMSLYTAMGRHDEARQCFDHAEAILQQVYGPKSVNLMHLYGNMAATYEQQGRYEEQIAYIEKGYQMAVELDEGDGQLPQTVLPNLYLALAQQAERQPTEQMRQRLHDFMADKLIIGRVVPGGGAAQRGLHGDYVLLEYDDWVLTSDECLFLRFLQPGGSPVKDLTFMRDGQVSRHTFDGRIGVNWQMVTVGADERQQTVLSYKQWKQNSNTK